MENKVIKSETRLGMYKIVLRNLTKKQKELLSSVGVIAGGIGLGGGLFTLYSMNEPNSIPGIQTNFGSELIHGEMESKGGDKSTEPVVLYSKSPIQEVLSENISFGEAFKVARNISGPGGWFIWKGGIYNTYYKEEWESMPNTEKEEYLASMNTPNVPDHTMPKISVLSDDHIIVEQPHAPVAHGLNEPSDIAVGQILFSDKNEIVEEPNETHEPEQVVENGFTIDFSNLYKVDHEVSVEPETHTLESPDVVAPEVFLQGEIITLDDDVDFPHHDIFELADDVEITVVPEVESMKLDSIVMDSSQITEFPWGESIEKPEHEIGIEDPAVIPENMTDHSHEIHVASNDNSDDEYPWGEPIVKKDMGSILSEVSHAEKIEEAPVKLIANPQEITEYPWGETVATEGHQVTGVITPETTLGEVHTIEDHSQPISSFANIEEFPWGEKNDHFSHEQTGMANEAVGELIVPKEIETIGVIVDENNEPALHDQLPSSFNDITEYPWGEPVHNSPLGFTNADDIDNSFNDHHTDSGHLLTDSHQ